MAYAQDSAVYLATYVEVTPNAAASGTALLKRYRDASHRENGNLRFDVLQETAQPNRFAIVEVWKDKSALDGHNGSATTLQFRDKLKAIADAPYDERINSALYVGRTNAVERSGTIYVLTHVDVIPTGKDDCMAALKAMSTDTPNDPGNLEYEVLQQAGRSNHFTVVEAWINLGARDVHAAASHTRSFRDRLAPLAGALYDERIYTAVN